MTDTGNDAGNGTSPGGSSARKSRLLPWLTYLILGPLMAIATIAFGTVAMIASLFDGHGGVQHRLAQAWASTLLRLSLSPAEVVGPGTLKRDGPAVYAANHLSYMDTPLVFSKLPFQFRIVARSGLWKIPFIGWYLHRSGQIPVDSTSLRSSIASMNGGAKALKSGTPLVIFPEGGRSPEGKLQPFMNGPAYMAVKAGVPIVPLALIGTHELLPMHGNHLRPFPLRLAVGEEIDTSAYTTRDLDPLTAKVYAAIQDLQTRFAIRDGSENGVEEERMQHAE
jgi:1-acyl-sn-glycerol-3-phosphate acyltransferase